MSGMNIRLVEVVVVEGGDGTHPFKSVRCSAEAIHPTLASKRDIIKDLSACAAANYRP